MLARSVGGASTLRLAFCLVWIASSFATAAPGNNSPESDAQRAYAQRAAYRAAVHALDSGDLARYERLRSSLGGYVLAPYLEYSRLNRDLARVSPEDIIAFIQANTDLPATRLLHLRWLKQLGRQRQWSLLLAHDRSDGDTELECYRLRARHGTGDAEAALDATSALWVTPRSQPKACDPLFEIWRTTERFTEERVFQRIELALDAGQRRLARYLLRYLTGERRDWAQAMYDGHINPGRIQNTAAFTEDNRYSRAAIAHIVKRLSRNEADAATSAWAALSGSHKFDAATQASVQHTLLIARADEGQFESTVQPDLPDAVLAELADAAVQHQHPEKLVAFVEAMQPQTRAEPQWQYWLGKSLAELHGLSERADLTLRALAAKRTYYGFLAADLIGTPVNLNDASRALSNAQIDEVAAMPGVKRALELFAVGDEINGRREWQQAMDQLPGLQKTALLYIAHNIGDVPLSIITANGIGESDNLQIRFPFAYTPLYRQAAHATALPVSWLFAISRQESAFNARANSSANARGLMQLLPSTARVVARRIGATTPQDADLFDPATNITLGSHHLAWLLNRYKGQRPLVAAAYNAGEHRVDRWTDRPDDMPMDVWIETIPFKETRNYVKNVLAFDQVYSALLGTPAPMLAAHEKMIYRPGHD